MNEMTTPDPLHLNAASSTTEAPADSAISELLTSPPEPGMLEPRTLAARKVLETTYARQIGTDTPPTFSQVYWTRPVQVAGFNDQPHALAFRTDANLPLENRKTSELYLWSPTGWVRVMTLTDPELEQCTTLEEVHAATIHFAAHLWIP